MTTTATTGRETAAGGRSGVRRLLVVLATWLCAHGAVSATGVRPPASDAQVSVRESDGLYRVSAEFQVPQPAGLAIEVLTDYEQIPRFMPDVRRSVVRARFPGGVVVEQEAVARVLLFSKRVHLLLRVQVDTDSVTFHDASGRSFSSYRGQWRLTPATDHTVISYELNARPSFDVPEFLVSRLLKRDASRMIDRLRAEITARSTR